MASQPFSIDVNSFLADQVKQTEKILGPFKKVSQQNENSDVKAYGHLILKNGSVYVGGLTANGLREGRGMQVWKDGNKYDGYWKNDMTNGLGRLIHTDGSFYEGNWKEDQACGQGTYKHYNGTIYKGEWLNDKQHGVGKEIWPDKSIYTGTYEEGKK